MLKESHRPLAALAIVALGVLGLAAATWWRSLHTTDAATEFRDGTRYSVAFASQWTRSNFPYDYPDGSLLHRPHFSGWIGTGHDAAYRIFMPGRTPSPGLEVLAERGRHSPLDDEILSAARAGHATSLAECPPLRDLTRRATFEIVVDRRHPWASAVAMIGPSPDWFTAFDVDLRDGSGWIERKTIDVYAWDAGGDEGMTYLAEDQDSNPKKPVTMATTMQFINNGRLMKIGTVTLTRSSPLPGTR